MVGCFEICAGVEGVEGRKFVASKMFTDMKRRYIFTPLVTIQSLMKRTILRISFLDVYSHICSERVGNPRKRHLLPISGSRAQLSTRRPCLHLLSLPLTPGLRFQEIAKTCCKFFIGANINIRRRIRHSPEFSSWDRPLFSRAFYLLPHSCLGKKLK